MELFGKDISLAIFDLDGTLLDSTGIWAEIDRRFFESLGMEVPATYTQDIAHIGLKGAAAYTRERYCPELSEEKILEIWHDLSQQAYRFEINLKEGALEALELLKRGNVKLAYATANSRSLYGPTLDRLNLWQYFDYGLDANNHPGGKEGPGMYDRIAAHFGVSPSHTLVFEDSLFPSRIAKAAGYVLIGVYDHSSTKKIEDHLEISHAFLRSFKEMLK